MTIPTPFQPLFHPTSKVGSNPYSNPFPTPVPSTPHTPRVAPAIGGLAHAKKKAVF